MLGGREDGAGPRGGLVVKRAATASSRAAARRRVGRRRRRVRRRLRLRRQWLSRVRGLMTWMTIFRSKSFR